jgi:hypothetical protein
MENPLAFAVMLTPYIAVTVEKADGGTCKGKGVLTLLAGAAWPR